MSPEPIPLTPELAPRLSHWQMLRVALTALNRRAEQWATLLLSFALFGYAAWRPGLWTLLAASLFTLLTHLPLWLRREAAG